MKSKEFLKSLAEYAAQLRQTIEAEADGFDASPAAIAERRAKVLDPVNGYEYFVNTYFPHYVRSSEKSELHEFLFSRLPEILQQPEGINEADAAPRGEAKSTLVTRLFSLWTVITGAKKFIVIAMDSIDQAYPMLEPDGFLTIKHISNKSGELAKYVPYRDGSLVYRGSGGEETCNTDVLYLFITHRATSTNPAGEMAAARLYAPVALRKKGFVYAAQFITRYAQPYLIAKIQANSEDDHNGFMSRFYRFVSGGALSIEREDDVMMLQNSADGQAFRRLENLANARIQKTLLGKVKTSDLETASRASQETEENNRDERIGAYLALLSRAAQHFIDALVMVNNAVRRVTLDTDFVENLVALTFADRDAVAQFELADWLDTGLSRSFGCFVNIAE